MPSRREPYGLVALEALASARPLLVNRRDGLLDHARMGAIAVDELSVDRWAAALSDLVADRLPVDVMESRKKAANAGATFAAGWAALLDDLAI